MELIKALNWRYATKKFDPSKKVKDEDFETLKEAVRLTATSYGLQAFKVKIISDDATKQKIAFACSNQPQITTAHHLFLFCNYTKVSATDVDNYLERISNTRSLDIEKVAPFGDYIKGALNGLEDEQLAAWTSKQTYIAMGTLLAAAGELKIDSCPMEGFDADQLNQLLDLNDKHLNVSSIVAVGYRSEDDKNQHLKKVRKSKEELFI